MPNALAIDNYTWTVRWLLICEYNLYYMLGNQQLDKSETNLCKALMKTSLCGIEKTCVRSDAWHICMRVYDASTPKITSCGVRLVWHRRGMQAAIFSWKNAIARDGSLDGKIGILTRILMVSAEICVISFGPGPEEIVKVWEFLMDQW